MYVYVYKGDTVIEIFRKIPDINTGVLRAPNWSFVKNGILENVNEVQSYYKKNARPVKSNHFLIRLLQSISISKLMSIERYFEHIDAIQMNLSMVFKMTSPIYKGIVHKNIFYGGYSSEILLAVDDQFNIYDTDKNWKDVQAVKILLHPKSDMNYYIPNGKQYSNEDGLSVISINIAMLAIQYRAFVLHELKYNRDNPRGINYFIGAYVLPNMLPSQTELCIFNRVYNLVAGKDSNDDISFKHPFALKNYKPFLDRALDNTIEYLERSNKSYRTVFHTVPAIYSDSIYNTLILPDVLDTRQVSWALVISRLKMIDFLIKVGKEETLNKNQQQLNQVIRELRLNDVYGVLKEILPIDIYFENEQLIENILITMGKLRLN